MERVTGAAEKRDLRGNALMSGESKVFPLRIIRPSTTRVFVAFCS